MINIIGIISTAEDDTFLHVIEGDYETMMMVIVRKSTKDGPVFLVDDLKQNQNLYCSMTKAGGNFCSHSLLL